MSIFVITTNHATVILVSIHVEPHTSKTKEDVAMYLMYVDECGDKGMGAGSSDYFILSGMVVHESMWTDFLSATSNMLDSLYEKYGLDRKLELHAKAMLGRSEKPYSGIKKIDRLLLLRDVLKYEGSLVNYLRIINVIVDKRNKRQDYDVFCKAWDALINKFENTIQLANFPIIKLGTTPAHPEHGLVVVDETDEKLLRTLIRKMRWNNLFPTSCGAGSCQNNLSWVIEDAMHKQSQHSIPIQLCDVNAYFLRQLLEPNSTIRKHDAQNYFYFIEPVLLKEASRKDTLGIVRL